MAWFIDLLFGSISAFTGGLYFGGQIARQAFRGGRQHAALAVTARAHHRQRLGFTKSTGSIKPPPFDSGLSDRFDRKPMKTG